MNETESLHYTSKPWHFIDAGDGKWIIRCDTSYATAGVMECLVSVDQFLGDPPNGAGFLRTLRLLRQTLADEAAGGAQPEASTASESGRAA